MSIEALKAGVQNALKNDRLLRESEVKVLTGIGKTKRGELMGKGEFPQSIKICGGRTNYWLASEIDLFIATQVERHRAEQAENLAKIASDPFNVLMNALVKKPGHRTNAQERRNA